MPEKCCQCCGSLFDPRPQVPNQTYCSNPACQLDRRKRWNQQKMQNDPDYRDNQGRIQRAWHDRNPDYWRKYRDKLSQQKLPISMQKTQLTAPAIAAEHAKMDASNCPPKIASGLYWIDILPRQGQETKGALVVEITPVCADATCKKDACKYRT